MKLFIIFFAIFVASIEAQNCATTVCPAPHIAKGYSGQCICECPNEPVCCGGFDPWIIFDPVTCKRVTTFTQIQNVGTALIDRVFTEAKTDLLAPFLPAISSSTDLINQAKTLTSTVNVHVPDVGQLLDQVSETLLTEQVPIKNLLETINSILPGLDDELKKFLGAWVRFFNCQTCSTTFDSLFGIFTATTAPTVTTATTTTLPPEPYKTPGLNCTVTWWDVWCVWNATVTALG